MRIRARAARLAGPASALFVIACAAAGKPLLAVPLEPSSPASRVGFDQHLGDPLPLDLAFRDETGRSVRLGELLTGRPIVLQLAYYECPMLCVMAMEGLARSLKGIALEPGKDFTLVTVSFKPNETPALARASKQRTLDAYGRPGADASWRFLTGDEASIRSLTAAVGFRYAWDEEIRQYAHATGIVLLTPDGRIARYLFGVEYKPRDLRLGLVEAGEGTIGTLADQLLLICYHYNPATGRYGAVAMGAMRAGGLLTIVGLAAFIAVLIRRGPRARAPEGSAGSPAR